MPEGRHLLKPRRFLLLPRLERSKGSGHLVRSLALRRALAARGVEARLLIPEGEGVFSRASVLERFGIAEGEWVGSEADPSAYDAAIADLYAAGRHEWTLLDSFPFIVGIDEGGPFRNRFDYLIDILPRLDTRDAPNMADALGFLDLPPRARDFPLKIESALISFGAEDRAGLGSATARALVDSGRVSPDRITLVRGSLNADKRPLPDGVKCVPSIPNLKNRLAEFDLVISHFGLTAYEAAAAGSAVLLRNPSPYHEALARKAGFPSLGYGRSRKVSMAPWIDEPKRVAESLSASVDGLASSRRSASAGSEAFAEFLLGLELGDLPAGRSCPACSGGGRGWRRPALYRDHRRSYRRCPACRGVSMLRPSPNPMSYGEGYFFEEYRAQYGRTYLEDLPNLRRMATSRLDLVEALSGSLKGKRVLDIGCAFGAFLLEAKDRGAICHGLDPSKEALEWLGSQGGVKTAQGFFPETDIKGIFGAETFSLLSMWYVAEHLPDLRAALAAARGLLEPGGLLAFSTPNMDGVSGRMRRESFLAASPADHVTILSPGSAKNIVCEAGFRLESVRVTGHHPERFPFPGASRGAGAGAWMAASKALGLGDTFEAYARRIR